MLLTRSAGYETGRPRHAAPPVLPHLAEAGVFEQVGHCGTGRPMRQEQLLAVREAVPAAVNARIARAKQTLDPRIEKTAADMIVPFDRFDALLDFYDAEFRRRGLDAAVWGHISDGNVHPNVIPRSVADVDSGKAAILEFGREVIRLGGAPLAEHGVGRNPVKQELLRALTEIPASRKCAPSSARSLPNGSFRQACCFHGEWLHTTLTTESRCKSQDSRLNGLR